MIINDLDYMEDAFYGISGGDSVSVYVRASASDDYASIGGSASASGDGYSYSSVGGYAYTDPNSWYYDSYATISAYSRTPGASANAGATAKVY